MFSIGNINEKLRIAQMDCNAETIVDMFAGIGYFVLPYVVHARAAHAYAIDWNEDAVEALNRNLELNGVADRCTVLLGDCRKVTPIGVADRVNLGLIPTARHYWLAGCKTLKPTGGILHIHETITDSKLLRKKDAQKMPDVQDCQAATSGSMTTCSAGIIGDTNSNGSLTTCENMQNDVSVVECTGEIAADSVLYVFDDGKLTVNSDLNGRALQEDLGSADKYVEEGTSTSETELFTENDEGEIKNSPENNDFAEKSTTRRKISRSATIIAELESRPKLEPLIDPQFFKDKWDNLDENWKSFAVDAAWKCSGFLDNMHQDCSFRSTILRIGKIKSYAPHIDHVVLDLLCKPEVFV